MTNCVIFAGAEIKDYSRINILKSDFVICADSGYLHARALGITPDLTIGDFDSYDISAVSSKTESYSPQKDDTDTMLAIKKGLSLGYENFKIYGAIGGRFDHSFANIQSLIYLKQQNAKGTIFSDEEIFTVICDNESFKINAPSPITVSVFALTKKVEGLTLDGFKYQVKDTIITNSFPIGVSNKTDGENSVISIKKGELLIIHQII